MKKYILPLILLLLVGSKFSGADLGDFKKDAAATLEEMQRAFQKEDAALLMQFISRRYQSANPAELATGLQTLFQQTGRIELKIVVDSTLPARDGKAVALKTHWEKRQFPVGSYRLQLFKGKTELIFGLEDGEVKLQSSRGDSLFI